VLGNEIPRSKILTFTRHGFMANGLAALRPVSAPILAITPHVELLRQLRLLRAVDPFVMPFAAEPDTTIENAIGLLLRAGRIVRGDKLIIATDIVSQDRLVDSVQLRTVT
jgi:pyruvate kinase